MSESIVIISKVLPVIFLIILGGFLKRFMFIKQGTVNELKKVVVNISLPSLLFMAFAETNFESRYMLVFAAVFITCLLMLLFGIIYRKLLKSENRYIPTLFSGFEAGMMGYSIFVAVYGSANMFKLAVIDLGQVTFVFFVLVSYLQRLNGKSASIKELILSFIKSPVIIAIITGILAGSAGAISSIGGFAVTGALLETLKLLSSLTVPLICIVIGYELHVDFKNILKPLITALSRLAVLMVLAFIINTAVIENILHLDKTFKIALYTMFLLPPPFVIPIFMEGNEEENKQFILNTISIHIILSLAAFLTLIIVMR